MSKARSAFTGALVRISTRSAITSETWVELEEALLLADVDSTVEANLRKSKQRTRILGKRS